MSEFDPPGVPSTPVIRHTTIDDPLAHVLLEDLAREYDERYAAFRPGGRSREMTLYPVERFAPEHGGAFLLVLIDGEPVAGGAFMAAEDGAVEVKRVWTRSDHRRQGLARRVMGELEAEAARRGVPRVVLTTGFRQPEAVGLYSSIGYEPLFDITADWRSVSPLRFEKRLETSSEPVDQGSGPVAT